MLGFATLSGSLTLTLLAKSWSRAKVPLNGCLRGSWCSQPFQPLSQQLLVIGEEGDRGRKLWLNLRRLESWSPFGCDLNLFLPPLVLSRRSGGWSPSSPRTQHGPQTIPSHTEVSFLPCGIYLIWDLLWKQGLSNNNVVGCLLVAKQKGDSPSSSKPLIENEQTWRHQKIWSILGGTILTRTHCSRKVWF